MLRNLLYFGIVTITLVISWIAFGLYHNVTTSTISSDISLKIEPIKETFDIETINNLRSRRVIKADLSKNITPSQQILTPSQNASGGASLGSTPSGNLSQTGDNL